MTVEVNLTLTEAEELTIAIPAWVAECRHRRGPRRARVLERACSKVHLARGIVGRWRSTWPKPVGENLWECGS